MKPRQPGVYESKLSPGVLYPKMQIITIEELLAGKMTAYPHMTAAQAFKNSSLHPSLQSRRCQS
jgi:hypothetical protein